MSRVIRVVLGESGSCRMTLALRPGPASIEGLRWLARVGPCPLDAWRFAMGWSEVAARSHARRLEKEGWLARYPMTRGEGCLFVATRTGVAVAAVAVRAAGQPAPTWWAQHCGVAWAAAWLTVRGHDFLGARQALEDARYAGKISWRDRRGYNTSSHRPDLLARTGRAGVAIEVELAKKSAGRLRAILSHYAIWRSAQGGAVIYVCADVELCQRVRTHGKEVGLPPDGGWLRVELLATIKQQALAGYEEHKVSRTPPFEQSAA